MTIEELFKERSKADVMHSDIWEHMETIRRFAERISTVCEIGCRTGNSATALLYGLSRHGGKMFSYDIADQQFTPPELPNVAWCFRKQDTHLPNFEIEPCELLFVDGCHKYESVKSDLRQQHRASRFIIMHDTSEERDKVYGDGVCRALRELIREFPTWEIIERYPNCNGLTVLERKP